MNKRAAVVVALVAGMLSGCGASSYVTAKQSACSLLRSAGPMPTLTYPATTSYPGQDAAVKAAACPGQQVVAAATTTAPPTTVPLVAVQLSATVSDPNAATDGFTFEITLPMEGDPSQQQSVLWPGTSWNQTVTYPVGTSIQFVVTGNTGAGSNVSGPYGCSITFPDQSPTTESSTNSVTCSATVSQ